VGAAVAAGLAVRIWILASPLGAAQGDRSQPDQGAGNDQRALAQQPDHPEQLAHPDQQRDAEDRLG